MGKSAKNSTSDGTLAGGGGGSVLDRRTGIDRRDIADLLAKLAAGREHDEAPKPELNRLTPNQPTPNQPESNQPESNQPESNQPTPNQPESKKSEASTGLERRRGPGRRRTDFMKSAEEGEMTSEQFMFVMAIEAFKSGNGKLFPTWTDVLEVIRKLGYRKTMASELNLRGAEDWREPADAPSGVHAKPGHPEDQWQREAA